MPVPETRARGSAPVIEERIRIVLGHLTNLTWDTVTAEALATQWGLSLSTVQNYSAEAWRYYKIAGEMPWLREVLVAKLFRSINACEQDGDQRGVQNGIDLALRATGNMPATKTKAEVSGPDGGPVQMAGVVVLPALEPEGNESE